MNRTAFEAIRPEAKIFDMSDSGVDLTNPFSGTYIELDLKARNQGGTYIFEHDILVGIDFFVKPEKMREVLESLRIELRAKYGKPKEGDFSRINRTGDLERVTNEVYNEEPVIILAATEKDGIETMIRRKKTAEIPSFEESAKASGGTIHKGAPTIVDLLRKN